MNGYFDNFDKLDKNFLQKGIGYNTIQNRYFETFNDDLKVIFDDLYQNPSKGRHVEHFQITPPLLQQIFTHQKKLVKDPRRSLGIHYYKYFIH